MSNTFWVVRTSQHLKTSSNQERSFQGARKAAQEALHRNQPCEIWQAKVSDEGDIRKEKHVLSAYPGHAPEEWFPHRYTPGPEDYTFHRINVPAGEFSLTPLADEKSIKSTDINQYEIEAALLESDLPSSQIEHAIKFLPDVNRLFEFLERKNQHKTINLLQRLLFY